MFYSKLGILVVAIPIVIVIAGDLFIYLQLTLIRAYRIYFLILYERIESANVLVMLLKNQVKRKVY